MSRQNMPRDINKIYGRITAVRRFLGLKQAEFAGKIGTTQGYLSELERGIKEPSDTLLIALIYRFAINPLWLYEGRGEMFIGHGEVAESPAAPYQGIARELRDMIEKVDFIFNNACKETRTLLYGHIQSAHIRTLEEMEVAEQKGPAPREAGKQLVQAERRLAEHKKEDAELRAEDRKAARRRAKEELEKERRKKRGESAA